MVAVFIVLYLLFYGYQILNYFLTKSKFLSTISKFQETDNELKERRNAVDIRYDGEFEEDARRIILKNLMSEVPRLRELLPSSYSSGFSTKYDARRIITNYSELSSDLITAYNEHIYRIKSCFNPIAPLKEIFLMPSKILAWFGLSLDEIASRVLSLITIIFGLIIKYFGTDIFNWIKNLL